MNTSMTEYNAHKQINVEYIITLALCAFLGGLGVHRFYNGKIGTGIMMLITFGGFGIWYIIDLIIVAVGGFKTKDGKVISIMV